MVQHERVSSHSSANTFSLFLNNYIAAPDSPARSPLLMHTLDNRVKPTHTRVAPTHTRRTPTHRSDTHRHKSHSCTGTTDTQTHTNKADTRKRHPHTRATPTNTRVTATHTHERHRPATHQRNSEHRPHDRRTRTAQHRRRKKRQRDTHKTTESTPHRAQQFP